MSKKPASLHPILWRAVEEAVGTFNQPVVLAPEGETTRRVRRYRTLRDRQTSVPATVGVFGSLLLFMGGVFLMGTPGGVYVAGAWLGAFLVAAWSAWRLWCVRSPSNEALTEVFPILRLTRTQRSAFGIWLAMDASPLDERTKEELRAGLDRLLDEEARLDCLAALGEEGGVQPGAIETERDALRARLDATADPTAREALEHGLRTCERRLEAARNGSAATERIDAQREMIGQAADDVRDGLLRLGTAPTLGAGEIEASSVREALAHVQAHAAALEAALAEVRTLEGRG